MLYTEAGTHSAGPSVDAVPGDGAYGLQEKLLEGDWAAFAGATVVAHTTVHGHEVHTVCIAHEIGGSRVRLLVVAPRGRVGEHTGE